MQVMDKNSVTANILRGLNAAQQARVYGLGSEYCYEEGVVCQTTGQTPKYVEIILEGRLGVEVNLSTAFFHNKVILDSLEAGEAFGLAALTGEAAWSKLRALESTRVLRLEPAALQTLCEQDKEIGYVILKNLSHIIVSRLRRERVLLLRVMSEIKVFSL